MKKKMVITFLAAVILGITCVASVLAASCEYYPCSALRKGMWCDGGMYSSSSIAPCNTPGCVVTKVYFRTVLGPCGNLPDTDDPNHKMHTTESSIIGEHIHIVSHSNCEIGTGVVCSYH